MILAAGLRQVSVGLLGALALVLAFADLGASTTIPGVGGVTSTIGDADGLDALSADGRYIAFWGYDDLVGDETQGPDSDVFVYDRQAGTFRRASVSSGEAEADGFNSHASISRNGRYVAFVSTADNLVAGDGNGASDVFVRDLTAGTTQRASLTATDAEIAGGVGAPFGSAAYLSGDGQHVAFTSSDGSIVAGDGNGLSDVFVRDLASGDTVVVSVDASGAFGDDTSVAAGVSANGRYVLFRSVASNLVPGDSPGTTDAFLHDRDADGDGVFDEADAGATSIEQVNLDDADVPTGYPNFLDLSGDGRHVVFMGGAGVSVRDLASGSTAQVDVATNGDPADGSPYYGASISDNGEVVAFWTGATNLVGPSGGLAIHDRDADDDGVLDEAGAIANEGVDFNGLIPSVSGDGTVVFDYYSGEYHVRGAGPPPTLTFTVNKVGDSDDGQCTTVHCTLREAINRANTEAGPDTITFDIADPADPSAPYTIRPQSALPTITQTLAIDGSSQPGFTGRPVLELDGSDVGPSTDGLRIDASNSVVRALAIGGFSRDGILVIGAFTRIVGCHIGLDATGSVDRGNQYGLHVSGGSLGIGRGVTIGGGLVADRNVISGNDAAGIRLTNNEGAIVRGNYVGTDASGMLSVPNNQGIELLGASNSSVGGSAEGLGNVIAGNGFAGISLLQGGAGQPATVDNVIEGNLIGLDASGEAALDTSPLPQIGIRVSGPTSGQNSIGGTELGQQNVIGGNNVGVFLTGSSGIRVQGNLIGVTAAGAAVPNGSGVQFGVDAIGNTVGGTLSGAGNVIALNTGLGIFSRGAARRNAVLGNAIYANGGLGIDLALTDGADGVTPNDAGDGDTGGNDLQNFPVLSAASRTPSTTTVTGTLSSAPSTTYRIELFANQACDSSGHGEARTFLGATSATTNGAGNATFSATLPRTSAVGDVVTATATDPPGNTSELSACAPVVDGGADTGTIVIVQDTRPDNAQDFAFTASAGLSPPTFTLDDDANGTLSRSRTFTVAAGTHSVSQAPVAGWALTSATCDDGSTAAGIAVAAAETVTCTFVNEQSTANLRLTQTANPATVQGGSTITFTGTVTNLGPGTGIDTVVTDDVPVALDNVAATSSRGSCTVTGRQVRCQLGNLANGAVATVTVTGRGLVPGQGYRNDMTVACSCTDPAPANNTASASFTVQTRSDLEVVSNVGPAVAYGDENVTYTVVVRNNGPTAASSWSVRNNAQGWLPISGTITLGSTTTSCTAQTGAVTCGVPLQPGQSVTVQATFRADSSGTHQNVATIVCASACSDPVSTNNTLTSGPTSFVVRSDLSGTVTHQTSPVPVEGKTFTVTARVTNPSRFAVPTASIRLSFAPSSRVEIVSISPGAPTCTFDTSTREVFCTLTNLNGNSTRQVTVTLRALTQGPLTTFLDIIACGCVNGSSANDHAEDGFTVTTSSDIRVTTDGPGSGWIGDLITFNDHVWNLGPSVGHGVVLVDTYPGWLDIVSLPSFCTAERVGANWRITCLIGDLASGQQVDLAIVVRLTQSGSFTHTISHACGCVDPTPVVTVVSATCTSKPHSDLSVTTVDPVGPVYLTEDLAVNYVLQNLGPSTATNVVVRITLPTGAGLVSWSAPAGVTCTRQSALVLRCTIASFAAGASITISIVCTPPGAGPFGGTVVISCGCDDRNPGNDSSSASGLVIQKPTGCIDGILYTSDRGAGDRDIWIVSPNSPYETFNVTNRPLMDDHAAAWAPGHAKMAYAAGTPNGEHRIAIVEFGADRCPNHPYYLANQPTGGHNLAPRWSPDGTRLVFHSNAGNANGNYDLWVANANGSVARIPNIASAAVESTGTWSHDGTRIVFQSDRSGNFDIWSVRPNGTLLTQLTNNSHEEYGPSYATETSNRLIWHRGRGDGTFGLVFGTVTDAGALTPDPGLFLNEPAASSANGDFSPSQSSPLVDVIVFDGGPGGGPDDSAHELYIWDGSGFRNITNNSANDQYPNW